MSLCWPPWKPSLPQRRAARAPAAVVVAEPAGGTERVDTSDFGTPIDIHYLTTVAVHSLRLQQFHRRAFLMVGDGARLALTEECDELWEAVQANPDNAYLRVRLAQAQEELQT